jgi:hypothetical protein
VRTGSVIGTGSVTSSGRTGSRYARRIGWLAAFVVFVVIAYSAGWHYLAGRAIQELDARVAALRVAGAEARCADAEMRGYPFRMGLFCTDVAFVAPDGAVELGATGLRSAAQIYDPARFVGEVDTLRLRVGPADGAGRAPAVAQANDVRFSGRLADPLPQRASVEARGIRVGGDPDTADSLMTIGEAQAHMRSRDGDLDIAASADDIAGQEAGFGRAFALPRASVDLTVSDGVARAAAGDFALRGIAGQLRLLELSTGGNSGLTASGPIAVGDDGLIDATLTLTLREPAAVAAHLKTIFPEQADMIDNVSRGLAVLGGSPTLPLSIRRGEARIAFVRLGVIPPLE